MPPESMGKRSFRHVVGRVLHANTAIWTLIWINYGVTTSLSIGVPLSRVHVVSQASKLIGCYQEPSCGNINNQTLQLLSAYDANLTVTKCVQLAAARKFLYAAIQAGTWCFGGSNISAYTQQVSCTQACSGAADQTCGGPCINAIYTTPSTSVYLGCYIEPYQTSSVTRYFQLLLVSNTSMTVQKCVSLAEALQLPYAAVQGASWCYGGSNYTTVYNSPVPCNRTCSGAPQQICGGTYSNAIYSTRFAAPPNRTTSFSASAPLPASFTGFPQNGSIYRIRNVVRSATPGCAAYVSVAGACGSTVQPHAVLSLPATNASQQFRFWQVQGSNNLFTMESIARPGCTRYLSSSHTAGLCVAGPDLLTLSSTRDQHTVFKLVPTNSSSNSSSFYMFPQGSLDCTIMHVSVQGCGNSPRQLYIDFYLPELPIQAFSLEPVPSTPWATTSLGCYQDLCVDGSCRALPNLLITGSSNMTPSNCIALAELQGFRFAAVQVGHQCFASNSTPPPTTSAVCSTPCTGDASLNCGGSWINSIYTASLSGVMYVGCYHEPLCGTVTQRYMTLLGGYGVALDPAMTILKCITLAEAGRYLYAAVQYGAFCFGGNDISAYTTTGVCNTPCSGASQQICGGFCDSSIYTTGYASKACGQSAC